MLKTILWAMCLALAQPLAAQTWPANEPLDAAIARYIGLTATSRLTNDNLMRQTHLNGFFPSALMAQQAKDLNMSPEDYLASIIEGFDFAITMVELLEEVINPIPLASGTTTERRWALLEKFNRSRLRSTGQIVEGCTRIIFFQEGGHWVATVMTKAEHKAAIEQLYPDLGPATDGPEATCAAVAS